MADLDEAENLLLGVGENIARMSTQAASDRAVRSAITLLANAQSRILHHLRASAPSAATFSDHRDERDPNDPAGRTSFQVRHGLCGAGHVLPRRGDTDVTCVCCIKVLAANRPEKLDGSDLIAEILDPDPKGPLTDAQRAVRQSLDAIQEMAGATVIGAEPAAPSAASEGAKCGRCQGSGSFRNPRDGGTDVCGACRGTGESLAMAPGGENCIFPPCDSCNGTGRAQSEGAKCVTCGGRGITSDLDTQWESQCVTCNGSGRAPGGKGE